jgi:hypothetical protein
LNPFDSNNFSLLVHFQLLVSLVTFSLTISEGKAEGGSSDEKISPSGIKVDTFKSEMGLTKCGIF